MQTNWIINDRGQRLAILESVPDNAHNILIVCHGFRGTKENRGRIFSLAGKMNSLGFGVVAFDFAGSGESEGCFAEVTLTNQAADLKNVLSYVKESYSLPVILLGRSFGGSTVIAGGCDWQEVAGFVLWSAPVFLPETFAAILADVYNRLRAGEKVGLRDEVGEFVLGPELVNDFDQHDFARYFKKMANRPILVVHGLKDVVVNPDNARHIAEYLPHLTLKLFPQADHKFTEYTDERENYTIEWLQSNFT